MYHAMEASAPADSRHPLLNLSGGRFQGPGREGEGIEQTLKRESRRQRPSSTCEPRTLSIPPTHNVPSALRSNHGRATRDLSPSAFVRSKFLIQ